MLESCIEYVCECGVTGSMGPCMGFDHGSIYSKNMSNKLKEEKASEASPPKTMRRNNFQ